MIFKQMHFYQQQGKKYDISFKTIVCLHLISILIFHFLELSCGNGTCNYIFRRILPQFTL